MLRLVTALALARAAAETTPPGTGYSDADSCPPPEKAPFGAVVTTDKRIYQNLPRRREKKGRSWG